MLKKARGHPQYVLIVSICVWSASLFLAIPTIMHSKASIKLSNWLVSDCLFFAIDFFIAEKFENNQCSLDWAGTSGIITPESYMCKSCHTLKNTEFCQDSKLPQQTFTLMNNTLDSQYCVKDHIKLIHSGCFCPINRHFAQVSS